MNEKLKALIYIIIGVIFLYFGFIALQNPVTPFIGMAFALVGVLKLFAELGGTDEDYFLGLDEKGNWSYATLKKEQAKADRIANQLKNKDLFFEDDDEEVE